MSEIQLATIIRLSVMHPTWPFSGIGRGRNVVACLLLLAALVSVPGGCGVPPGPRGTAGASAAPSIAQGDIDRARRFRLTSGLRTDDLWIQAVALDPAAAAGIPAFGVPLTPAELRELRGRVVEGSGVALVVEEYGAAHPQVYAGRYLDNVGLGGVIALFTADVDAHELAIRQRIHPSAIFDARPAARSLGELQDIQQRLTLDAALWRATGVTVVAAGVRPSRNAVEIDLEVSPTFPHADLQAEFDARYGHGAIEVAQVAAAPEAFGTIRGRAVDANGRGVAGLEVQLTNGLSSIDYGEIAMTTDSHGRFIVHTAPVGIYMVQLCRRDGDGPCRPVGASAVDVMRNAIARPIITIAN